MGVRRVPARTRPRGGTGAAEGGQHRCPEPSEEQSLRRRVLRSTARKRAQNSGPDPGTALKARSEHAANYREVDRVAKP